MKIQTYVYTEGWNVPLDRSLDSETTVLFMFGDIGRNAAIEQARRELCDTFPNAVKIGCSDAGSIFETDVVEHGLVAAAVRLQKSRLKHVAFEITSADMSHDIGTKIGEALAAAELKAIFLLSEGIVINGSELTAGINEALPETVVVAGGLAGDHDRFDTTYLIDDDCRATSGHVSAIGFYGEHFGVASAFKGGWDKFGIERNITHSKNNVLYTLNDEPALEVYKRYLGKYANQLPATALLFPLAIREKGSDETKVRTVLTVDEDEQSMTFAGNIPQGAYAAFMKANFDRLIDGAYEAAETAMQNCRIPSDALAIAISCIGRKLLLNQRCEEELEAVRDVLPPNVRQIGFYSYGEISPMHSGRCDLHNQTMTLTLLWET